MNILLCSQLSAENIKQMIMTVKNELKHPHTFEIDPEVLICLKFAAILNFRVLNCLIHKFTYSFNRKQVCAILERRTISISTFGWLSLCST